MIKFSKYQATGNDFILLDHIPQNVEDLSKAICDRHFGVGADGVLFYEKSAVADMRMHYYNADGSRAKMCGNGLRCFVRYLLDENRLSGSRFLIETDAGILSVQNDADQLSITFPIDQQAITTAECNLELDDQSALELDGHKLFIVRMSTLHAVVFVANFDEIEALGPKLTDAEVFPDHINVNFVQVLTQDTLFVRTHERGAGWTLSCGTGVAASALVAHRLGVVSHEVAVSVLGGSLKVMMNDEELILQGSAQKIASGFFEEDQT